MRMSSVARLLCLLIVFLVFASASPAYPQAPFPQSSSAACDSFPDVDVSVAAMFPDPYIVDSTPLYELQTLSRSGGHSIREGWTLGLTTYKPVIEIRMPISLTQTDSGLACAVVDKPDVRLGYKDVVVYVAREIPRNTCGFDEVFRHELKHIAVNRAVLDAYLPIVSERLREHLKFNGVIRQENPEYAVTVLREKLREIVEKTMLEMDAENVARQSAVDSREEYLRIGNACGGQLQNILGQFLRVNAP